MASDKLEIGFTISPDKFVELMDKVASDPTFRAQLDKDPIKTLDIFGFQLNEETRSLLEGKPLHEMIRLDPVKVPQGKISSWIKSGAKSGAKSAAASVAKNIILAEKK